MKSVLIVAFIFSGLSSFSQSIGMDEVDESKLSKWLVDNSFEYHGKYYFGFSESESSGVLKNENGKIVFKLTASDWVTSPDGNILGTVDKYETFTNIEIRGNKFFSDETEGEFVLYDEDGVEIRCLKLNKAPFAFEDGAYELGCIYTNGEYPITEVELISQGTLREMSIAQLKIMRNEILARHGYIFSKGGQMETYFSKKIWYEPRLTNVDNLLTDIERKNIENIIKIESEKK